MGVPRPSQTVDPLPNCTNLQVLAEGIAMRQLIRVVLYVSCIMRNLNTGLAVAEATVLRAHVLPRHLSLAHRAAFHSLPQLFFAKVLRSTTEDQVRQLFGQFGKVQDINMFRAFQGAPTTKVRWRGRMGMVASGRGGSHRLRTRQPSGP